jgi:hypothetical protein
MAIGKQRKTTKAELVTQRPLMMRSCWLAVAGPNAEPALVLRPEREKDQLMG